MEREIPKEMHETIRGYKYELPSDETRKIGSTDEGYVSREGRAQTQRAELSTGKIAQLKHAYTGAESEDRGKSREIGEISVENLNQAGQKAYAKVIADLEKTFGELGIEVTDQMKQEALNQIWKEAMETRFSKDDVLNPKEEETMYPEQEPAQEQGPARIEDLSREVQEAYNDAISNLEAEFGPLSDERKQELLQLASYQEKTETHRANREKTENRESVARGFLTQMLEFANGDVNSARRAVDQISDEDFDAIAELDESQKQTLAEQYMNEYIAKNPKSPSSRPEPNPLLGSSPVGPNPFSSYQNPFLKKRSAEPASAGAAETTAPMTPPEQPIPAVDETPIPMPEAPEKMIKKMSPPQATENVRVSEDAASEALKQYDQQLAAQKQAARKAANE